MSFQWFGQAGHFCDSAKCRFHLHTHVGNYCISTVGEYFPTHPTYPEMDASKPQPLGESPHLYETMVFCLSDVGDHDGTEIDVRRWITRFEANQGHMLVCRKWESKK